MSELKCLISLCDVGSHVLGQVEVMARVEPFGERHACLAVSGGTVVPITVSGQMHVARVTLVDPPNFIAEGICIECAVSGTAMVGDTVTLQWPSGVIATIPAPIVEPGEIGTSSRTAARAKPEPIAALVPRLRAMGLDVDL